MNQNNIKNKPGFECPLIATDAQKQAAEAIYDTLPGLQELRKIDFELIKFFPQNYFFHIGVEDDNDKLEDTPYKLECDKTLGELRKSGLLFHIAICDSEGTWYDDGRESAINCLVCPSILTSGGGEAMLEACDANLTANDVVAFLERRGMKYLENIWQKVEMINFRSSVNDEHLWAYPNPDLTPTNEQMWDMVRKKHMTELSMYKNYLTTDMMTWYVHNNDNRYTKDFREQLKEKLITDEKAKIQNAIEPNNATTPAFKV